MDCLFCSLTRKALIFKEKIEFSIDQVVAWAKRAEAHGADALNLMTTGTYPFERLLGVGRLLRKETSVPLVAISRLVMGNVPRAHCTHEPHAASLMAGANLFFPEVGSSPRDGEADTEKGRGTDIEICQRMQREMGWNPLLPSNCFEMTSTIGAVNK